MTALYHHDISHEPSYHTHLNEYTYTCIPFTMEIPTVDSGTVGVHTVYYPPVEQSGVPLTSDPSSFLPSESTQKHMPRESWH